MRRRKRGQLISLLISLTLCMSLVPSTPALAVGCSVSGRVYDAASGAGLSAKVILFKKVSFWDPVGGSGEEWRAVAVGYSSSTTGQWSISKYTTSDLPEIIDSAPDLPAGTYRIGFVPLVSGYQREVYDNVIDYDVWAGKDVVLSAGQSLTGIDAGLSNGWGKVSGRVSDKETGAPIANAMVDVQYWSASLRDWVNWTRCDTATDGTFITDRFPSGQVRIRYYDRSLVHAVSFWPGTPREVEAQVVTVGAGEVLNGSVALEKRAILTGRVTNATTGAPLSDIEITAYWHDASRDCWSWDSRAYSGADGRYTLRVNGGGEYVIEYRDWSGSYKIAEDDHVSFYPEAATQAEASTVAVVPGQTVAALDATVTATVGNRLARVSAISVRDRAVALSREYFRSLSTSDVVLLNPGDRGAVAAAPALAASLGAPMLYATSTSVSSATLEEIGRLGARRVLIVGSTTAIGTSVVSQLGKRGLVVRRMSAPSAQALSTAALRKVRALRGASWGRRVVVVSSNNRVEIGIASLLAYRLKAPIVLTGSTLPSVVERAMRDTGVRSAIVVGSASSVSYAVTRRLSQLHISTVRRCGADPAGTAYSVSSYAVSAGWAGYGTVSVAGSSSSDMGDLALAGMVAGRRRGVMLLTTSTSAPSKTLAAVRNHRSGIRAVRIAGTATQVRTAVMVKLSDALY